MPAKSVLEIENLCLGFRQSGQELIAVDGIKLKLIEGRCLGVVGESGCGKSLTALSIMGLLPQPFAHVFSGQITLLGKDVTLASDKERRKINGKEISMIFQEPLSSLNPVFTCGHQIHEALSIHNPELSKKELKLRAIHLLKKVGIPDSETRYNEYPHQLSGGMRQRIMIAIAISCEPKVLIADEPTTALDVTIQAQIIELLKDLVKKQNMSLFVITHDFGVVNELCDDVAVMYAGQIVESASKENIFTRPAHPYTKGLLESIPSINSYTKKQRLKAIQGTVPLLGTRFKGCRFYDRCTKAQDRCKNEAPLLTEFKPKHRVACHFKNNQEISESDL